jgi:hypothetical protein
VLFSVDQAHRHLKSHNNLRPADSSYILQTQAGPGMPPLPLSAVRVAGSVHLGAAQFQGSACDVAFQRHPSPRQAPAIWDRCPSTFSLSFPPACPGLPFSSLSRLGGPCNGFPLLRLACRLPRRSVTASHGGTSFFEEVAGGRRRSS